MPARRAPSFWPSDGKSIVLLFVRYQRRQTMITTSKLAIAAIAALCFAAPAPAQSFDPQAGSGNVVAQNGGRTAPQNGDIAVHRRGLNAYAKVPRQAAPTTWTDPTVNGGGSAGYNDTILKY
jgi:hypothetical protein